AAGRWMQYAECQLVRGSRRPPMVKGLWLRSSKGPGGWVGENNEPERVTSRVLAGNVKSCWLAYQPNKLFRAPRTSFTIFFPLPESLPFPSSLSPWVLHLWSLQFQSLQSLSYLSLSLSLPLSPWVLQSRS